MKRNFENDFGALCWLMSSSVKLKESCMEKEPDIKRFAIYTDRQFRTYVLCRQRLSQEWSVTDCKKCEFHCGVERQDSSNPFNHNWEVLCACPKDYD